MYRYLLRLTILYLALFCGSPMFGQAGDYNFAVSTSTYVPLGPSATQVDILADTKADTVAIGFDFYFEGIAYDSAIAASDGFLSFLMSATSTLSNDLDNGSPARRPLVAPLWDDHDGRASSSAAAYEVTGTAPNRVFTMEWRDWEWSWNATDSVVSFQVKLYETTNTIEFHYRWECVSCITSPDASIGLSGATTFLSVTDIATGTPTASNTLEDSNIDSVVTDQVLTFTPPTCPSPSFLSFTDIKTDSLTINWSSTGSGPWYVYWGPVGFDQATPGVSLDTSTTTSFIAHGLNASTGYSFFIKEDCGGGDTSKYAGPFTQTTAYVPPYLETFANGYPGADYTEATGALGNPTIFTSTTSSAWKEDGFANVGSTGAVSLNIYGTSRKEWFMSPSIDLGSGTTTYQLEFDAAVTDWNGPGTDAMGPDDSVVVVISTDNGATWSRTNMLMALTAADNIPNGNGLHFTTSLAGYSGWVKFGFYAESTVSNTDYDFHIDNIEVRVPPACPDPAFLTYTQYGGDSVIVSWKGSAGSYNYSYGPAPTLPGAGTTTATTDTFAVLTGLTANTAYDFHVQSSCSGGSTVSAYVNTSFTTPCAAFTAPYLETFDDTTWVIGSSGGSGDAINACWSRNSNTGYKWSVYNASTSSSNTGPDADHTGNGGNFLFTEASSSSPSLAQLTSPLVDISTLTTPYLSFWYHRFGDPSDMGDLLVEVNDGSGWDTVVTITGVQQTASTDPYLQIGADISAYSGTIQVRFTGVQKATFEGDMAIDDFEIDEAPSCIPIVNLTASGVVDTAATLNWDATSTATSYEVWFGPQGFYQGSGTMGGARNITSGNSLLVDTLSPQTCYEFLVRGICGAGDTTAWTGPYSFCTPCMVMSAPFYDNLNAGGWVPDNSGSATNSAADPCWGRNPDNGSAYSWRVRSTSTSSSSTGPNQDFDGTGNFAYAEASSGSTGNVAELITPSVNMAGTTAPLLSYAYHFYGSDINKMYIDIHDGTNWVSAVDSIIGEQQTASSDPWVLDTIDLSAYSSNTIKVRFRAISGGCCSGDLAIDEVYIGDPRTCARPTALSATATTTNSATISWTSGGATDWQLEYGPVGFTPGTGTLVNVSTNPYTLTGLTGGTCYDVIVRDSCSATSVSLWSAPITVTTAYPVLTFPIVEDFENGFTSFGNNCLNPTLWNIQQTIFNGGSNAAKLAYQGNDTSYLRLKGTIDLTNTTAPVLMFAQIAKLEGGWDEAHVQISTDGGQTYEDLPDSTYMGAAAGYVGNEYFDEDDYTIWGTSSTPALNTWWMQEKFDLSGYKTSNVVIRFQVDSDGSIQRDGWYLDDIMIVEDMSCSIPTGVTVSNISCDSVEVSWMSDTAATSSYIEYGAKGFIPGTGTVAANVMSPYTINGLALNTEYDVYIVDSCGANGSNPSPVTTFKTDSLGPVLASFTYTQVSTTLTDADVDFDASGSTGDGLTYSWDFDGSTGTGVNGQATYTANGTYNVMLTVTDRCGNTDDTTITITVAGISIVENAYNAGIEMYPNPSQGTFKVNVTNGNGTYAITVMDLSGKVLHQQADLQPGVATEIDLGQAADGVYLLHFSGDGLNATQRIVVE